MPERSISEQDIRQHLSAHWQPNGFDRYVYQKKLLDGMQVLSGLGGNPDRYRPATPCQDTLDCTCGMH